MTTMKATLNAPHGIIYSFKIGMARARGRELPSTTLGRTRTATIVYKLPICNNSLELTAYRIFSIRGRPYIEAALD